MTPEEITKLAEQYAEEIYPHEEFEDIGQMDFLRNTAQKNAMDFMQFLLRTHCIVSKEKVNEEYQKALNQIAGGRGYDIPRIESYGTGKRKVLESIFDPDTFDETDK